MIVDKNSIASIEDAIACLSSNFEVIGNPIDLRNFGDRDGEKAIFDQLSKLHQDYYKNHHRIVVIQGHEDIYTYEDNRASDSLIFLQKSLQKIDISNDFVVVVSFNPELGQELNWVQENFSTNDHPIQHLNVDGCYQKITPNEDTFCILPWIQLHIDSQSQVQPCCASDTKMSWGDASINEVDDLVNSDRARKMRLNMLSNRKCRECSNCYDLEKYQMPSTRIRANEHWKHLKSTYLEKTNTDGSLKEFKPVYLDLRLNNTCNLKCRTCSGYFSSNLAQEEKNLFANVENFKKILTQTQRIGALNKVMKYVDHAEHIYFAGGEPLIMHEHYAILDQLVRTDNLDTGIFYNTNFTTLEFKGKHIFDYWKNFTNITIGASIDGHGDVFEYVRHGAKWNDIENNLQNLKEKCPNVKFSVTSVISLLSAESVMKLQKNWHESGKLDINNFSMMAMGGSDYLSLQSLLDHHKKHLSFLIDQHCDWLDVQKASDLRDSWQNMKQLMWAADKSYVCAEFARVNRRRDISRGVNFESVYPQYRDLFSGHY